MIMSNNDPRRWGLGAYAKNTSDLDGITDTGWYAGSPLVDGDITLGGSIIQHFQYENSKNATQIAYTNGANSWNGNIILIREKKNNVWNPWEWNNPPMRLSVEYRTTERWNGKPVYKVALETGTLYIPGNTAVTGTWNANCTIIQVDAYILAADGSTTNLPSSETASDMRARCWVKPDGGFYVKTYSGLASGATAHAVISYVKN